MKLNKLFLIPVAGLALGMAAISCDSEGEGNIQWWDWSVPEPVEPNQNIVDLGWTNETATLAKEYGEVPEHIQLYKAPAQLCNKNVYGYIAVLDNAQGRLNVLGEAEGLVTPSAQYDASKAPIIVNGGFFYLNTLSLILRDGELIAPNNQVDSPDWSTTYYYMPRGTFSILKDNTIEVSWVYTLLSGVSYSYPTSMPLENGRVPEANYPEGGKVYEAKTGIGGGPVLTKAGEIINSHEDEYLTINPTSHRPRTAIGYNPETNRIVLFACGGDGQHDVAGLTLEDVANVMLQLGCSESVNLDGGGSTVMLYNGVEIVKPSGVSQRSVGSCVAFY